MQEDTRYASYIKYKDVNGGEPTDEDEDTE
jgi:hypothetical protein